MGKVIGLMGGSGSGKSTVARYLQQKGAYVIDADEVSHEICEVGQPGYEAVRLLFEPYFFNDDGTLNRKRLGRHVFSHPAELKKLEGALHPLIVKRVQERVAARPGGTIVVDCALLVQTGLNRLADEVWLVTASEDTKIERICARDGLPVEQAVSRLRNQLPDGELMKYADRVLVNDGVDEALIAQVEEAL